MRGVVDNVVSLNGAPVLPPGEPDPRIIDTLEGVLAEAKAGRVSSLILGYLDHEDNAGYRLGGDASVLLLGVATRLVHKVNVEIDG